jgi:hypothetical protein
LSQQALEGIPLLGDRDRTIMGARYSQAEEAWLEYDYPRAKRLLEEIIEKISG